MTAVEYRVFDDLMIGNFMKTTLHGSAKLYPGFTPYVAKYADNGLAETKKELGEYPRPDLRSRGYQTFPGGRVPWLFSANLIEDGMELALRGLLRA